MDHASLLPEWRTLIYRNGALLFTEVVHYYLPILVHCYLPITSLRQVRNEGQHRCEIIKNNKEEPLHKFFKFNTFETVHSLIETLKSKIIENL